MGVMHKQTATVPTIPRSLSADDRKKRIRAAPLIE